MTVLADLPSEAKVWIYQSNRFFTDQEIKEISIQGEAFVNQWSAHGAKLKASFEVLNSLFILVAVDEQQANASGCSIDKSVHFIKQLEQQYTITLFDRFRVAFTSGEEVFHCSYSKLLDVLENNFVDAIEDVIVFDNTISTKAAFDSHWKVPLKNSWMKMVLNK